MQGIQKVSFIDSLLISFYLETFKDRLYMKRTFAKNGISSDV